MPTTVNKGYSTPVTGTESGVWGDTLNANFAIIDKNFGGVLSLPITNTNVTLTTSQSQNLAIILSGTLTGNVDIIFPAVGSFYKIINKTIASTFYVRLYVTGGLGNIICAPPSNSNFTDVVTDGTDFYYCGLGTTGVVYSYPGTALPAWMSNCTVQPFLYADGSSFNGSTYRQLRDILGGTTLPDLRGRAVFHINDGTGRLTTAQGGVNGNTNLSVGGVDGVTLATTQIAPHTHGVNDPGHSHLVNARANINNSTSPANHILGEPSAGFGFFDGQATVTMDPDMIETKTTGITNQNTGGGLVHTNMPPAVVYGIPVIKT